MSRPLSWLPVVFALGCADTAPSENPGPGGAPPPGVSGAADAYAGGAYPIDAGSSDAAAPAQPKPPPGDPLDDPHAVFCEGEGPVVEIGDREEVIHRTCAGDIAAMLFTNALCICENTRIAGALQTRGFDSDEGPPDEDDGLGFGAAVGMNGTYEMGAGYTDVGGSMSIAGPADLTFIGYLHVHGDLRLGGNALVPGYANVERDAWLAGDFASGPLRVARDLHQGGTVLAIPLDVRGRTAQEAVAVRPPCPCDAPVDIDEFIAQVRARNDNALARLDPGALKQVVGAVSVELPCGRYYVDEISGIGDIRVRVSGRVALMVGGPVATAGQLRFDLAPDAEIDLFIAGDLGSIGNAVFGDRDRPAATRIYVAGQNDIVLIGATAFVGNVYAPHARVTAPGFLQAYGSFFARGFEVPGYARILYDRAITDGCDPDDADSPNGDPADPAVPDHDGPYDGPCDLCGSCTNGEACVDGACGPCRIDDDCCGQLVCTDGVCEVYAW